MARKVKSPRLHTEDVKPFIVIASYHVGGGAYRHLEERFLDGRQAHCHIDVLLDDREFERGTRISGDAELRTTDGEIALYVANDRLDEVLDHHYENKHQFAPRANVHYLLQGPREHAFQEKTFASDDEDVPSPRKSRTRRTERTASTGRRETRKERTSVEGLVTANAIAEELGVPGSTVRSVIRGMKLEKVNGGWFFDEDTARKIKKKVKAK